MATLRFNNLPLHIKKTFVFPHAELVSTNQNEAFRIAFYSYNDILFEVCFDVASNKIEDIRCINEKYVDPTLKKLIIE